MKQLKEIHKVVELGFDGQVSIQHMSKLMNRVFAHADLTNKWEINKELKKELDNHEADDR